MRSFVHALSCTFAVQLIYAGRVLKDDKATLRALLGSVSCSMLKLPVINLTTFGVSQLT